MKTFKEYVGNILEGATPGKGKITINVDFMIDGDEDDEKK